MISNGFHPDKLKREQIPQTQLRLDILMNALSDWNNPKKSLPAKIASKEEINHLNVEYRKSKARLEERNSEELIYFLFYSKFKF